MSPTLLILAAGMGSRYGGLKQMDGVGPKGETLLDYAVHDGIGAGFGRLVFVIRREFEAAFRAEIVSRYAGRVPVELVYQDIGDLPAGFAAPPERSKPWGTGHAVWAARDALRTPFAVINADDFYGRGAFETLCAFLVRDAAPHNACLVGYRLERTLSPHGSVSRGVCTTDAAGRLTSVVEHTDIARGPDGVLQGRLEGNVVGLPGNATVSMNCWGLHPGVLPGIERELVRFLRQRSGEAKSEFYLPAAISGLMERERLSVKVLSSDDPWFGVTYREDREAVAAALRELVAAGRYPGRL